LHFTATSSNLKTFTQFLTLTHKPNQHNTNRQRGRIFWRNSNRPITEFEADSRTRDSKHNVFVLQESMKKN
ncbi:hypothetical protein VIGAN_02019800, partial [Vigna angularis var. angularis]